MLESIQLELSDRTDMRRIEFGDWRIVFRLDEPNREITITRIRRRNTAYIGLERPPRQKLPDADQRVTRSGISFSSGRSSNPIVSYCGYFALSAAITLDASA